MVRVIFLDFFFLVAVWIQVWMIFFSLFRAATTDSGSAGFEALWDRGIGLTADLGSAGFEALDRGIGFTADLSRHTDKGSAGFEALCNRISVD